MLIALEGIDAAGKRTQADLLRARAEARGLTTTLLSFPRYSETHFGAAVAAYLNGAYGAADAIDPHLSALLFAGDRFESRAAIDAAAAAHDVVLFDRYVSSNLAYQAARLDAPERPAFLAWLARLEYEVYRLPRAELTLYLDVPVETASRLIYQRKQRAYTTEQADLYERDTAYLARCAEVYQHLIADDFESRWQRVRCTDAAGAMRPPEAIGEAVWTLVEPYLQAARTAS